MKLRISVSVGSSKINKLDSEKKVQWKYKFLFYCIVQNGIHGVVFVES